MMMMKCGPEKMRNGIIAAVAADRQQMPVAIFQ
jgi:hypothetical protein